MKLYEINLEPNSDFIFWVKDGFVYHHLDKKNPYPYDAAVINQGIIEDGAYINRRPMNLTKIHFVPFAVRNEKEIHAQIQAVKDECLSIDENRNVIIAHRRVDNYTVMALAGFDAKTDKEISWDTKFRQ